jgi:hypothetical protein
MKNGLYTLSLFEVSSPIIKRAGAALNKSAGAGETIMSLLKTLGNEAGAVGKMGLAGTGVGLGAAGGAGLGLMGVGGGALNGGKPGLEGYTDNIGAMTGAGAAAAGGGGLSAILAMLLAKKMGVPRAAYRGAIGTAAGGAGALGAGALTHGAMLDGPDAEAAG